jgi:hypothetical protein
LVAFLGKRLAFANAPEISLPLAKGHAVDIGVLVRFVGVLAIRTSSRS